MANFATLKAAINAVIKTNGNKEITGEVLNQVLNAMVTSLGANYQFAGVATPSTNPGTPDQNVFYMATEAGTYTNFNATVLPAGISILLWNGSWSHQTFFEIDSVPTSGSDNFISSGAVFEKMKLDGGAYDVSAHNSGATFANLSALLSSDNLNTLIPVDVRHGGMSIKFVQSSDNKYHQFTYLLKYANTTAGNASFATSANWQEVKDSTILTLEDGVRYDGETLPDATVDSTYDSIKLAVIPGEKYMIAARGGNSVRLYFTYNAQGTLVRVADSAEDHTGNPLLLTIGETERWLCINCRNIYPAYIRYVNFVDSVARHTQELNKIESTDIPNINTNISAINNAIAKTEDVASQIVWIDNRFIAAANGVITYTSATNKIGTISVAGCKKATFNWSVKNGGGYDKLGWMIKDKNGNILSKSDNIPKTPAQAGDAEIILPTNADTLYVSQNTSLGTTQTCVLYKTLDSRVTYLENETKDIKSDISEINQAIDDLENFAANYNVVNIENIGVQAFMDVRYNDADYSYTKFPYAIAGAGDPGYEHPNGYTIDTPVDNSYVSRSLDIADNANFTDASTIALDLVSDTYTIVNLEGHKLYYFRVYYDGSTSNVISSGRFKTEGSVRDLLIPANSSNPEGDYIGNVRDIGGWPTCDGKRLRYGCVFRGYELNHDTDGTITSYISQDGIDELKALGVSAELDLRGGYSESALGNDVAFASIPVDLFFFRLNIYVNPVSRLVGFKECLQQIITWVSAGKGIYAHCQGGCDRTGFLCALIEGICGVSENDINHDYELSNRDRSREKYTIAGGDDYDGDFKFAIEYIKGLLEYNGNIYVYYRGNYYDPTAEISHHTPVPISDASLLAALSALPFGSFKECWHRLMKIGGVDMSERDMQKLEKLLCS